MHSHVRGGHQNAGVHCHDAGFGGRHGLPRVQQPGVQHAIMCGQLRRGVGSAERVQLELWTRDHETDICSDDTGERRGYGMCRNQRSNAESSVQFGSVSCQLCRGVVVERM